MRCSRCAGPTRSTILSYRAAAGDAALDDQTWSDLLLPRYLERLSAGVSIFGRQVLYQRLRNGVDGAACDALGERSRR
jgi:hypothetical protein